MGRKDRLDVAESFYDMHPEFPGSTNHIWEIVHKHAAQEEIIKLKSHEETYQWVLRHPKAKTALDNLMDQIHGPKKK